MGNGLQNIPVFSQNPQNRQFQDINENTQWSCYLQREIAQSSTMLKTDKRIGSSRMTSFAHDQKHTMLCTSYSVMSGIRCSGMSFLGQRGVNRVAVLADLEDLSGEFSFHKMLTLYTGTVSIRNLDGIIENSKDDGENIRHQVKRTSTGINRLVEKTFIFPVGWTRIMPLVNLFQKYGVNPDEIELISFPVFHPNSMPHPTTDLPNPISFNDAIHEGHCIVLTVFCNLRRSHTNNYPHAVVLYGVDGNNYIIKNSYYNRKIIQVDQHLPTYDAFRNNPDLFRENHPGIRDDDYITYSSGTVMKFRNKSLDY